MIRRTSLALATLSLIASCGGGTKDTASFSPQTNPPVTTTVTAQAPATTTTSTTTTEVPLQSDPLDYIDEQRQLHGRCGEWHDLALEVGWQEEQWSTLSAILYRESRCTPDAFNGHDAGLSQINQVHTVWADQMGFTWPEDLFIPRNNLYFAYRLYSGREENGQCGWTPWSKTCR